MKLLISLLLVIILCIVYRKSRVSYVEGFTLYFTICVFCFQGSYFYLSPLKFLNVGLLMFTFLYWKKKIGKNEQLPIDLKRLFYTYFFFQIILLVLSSFNDGLSLSTQVYSFLKFSYLKFGLAFLAFFAIKQIKDIERFNRYLKIMTFFVCIYGIIEYFIHINVYTSIMGKAFPELQEVSEGFHDSERGIISSRILGTFMHALNLGQMLIIFLGYFTIIRKYIGLKIYYVLATFILITITFTGSRSCVLPAYFLYGVCAFVDFRSRIGIFKILLFIGIPILLLLKNITFSEELQSTINSFFFFWSEDKAGESLGGSSVDFREQQWEMVLYILGRNFLLFGRGIGFMSTGDYAQFQEIMAGAESILFTYTMEQGLVGLVAFLILLSCLGMIMAKYSKDTYGRQEILIYIFVLSYMMSLIFTGDRSSSYVFFTLALVYIKSNIIFKESIQHRLKIDTVK